MFAGIRGGVGRLPAAIADASGCRRPHRRDGPRSGPYPYGWRIETGPAARPEAVDADAVIVAVPATPAARLLSDAVPMASTELAGLEYASVAVTMA